MSNDPNQSSWKGSGAAQDQSQSLVQAWARDTLTGEPVYIMELGPNRRGGHCGCECPSCDQPLTAVNAAKSEYIKRPHFRHPHGAAKSECMFLAARLAALQLLREQGLLELPARRIAGKVHGLSGTQHEVWVTHPAERVKIANFDFRDRAAALLTLDDGRQLLFNLIGSAHRSDEGTIIPSIYLELADADLAGLSQEELRKRITLIPDSLCWQSHWNDTELQVQAHQAAMAKAIDFMDLEGDFHSELDGVEQTFRRETLLHLEVKRILSEAREICGPEFQCYVLRTADDGRDIEKSIDFPSERIPLLEVAMEQRFGRLIPDITAKTPDQQGGVLLIEVTVTNVIGGERLAQIRDNNVPAIEIDLSRTGGLITRSELRRLVVEDLEFKRWLCHPRGAQCQQELEADANAQLQAINWEIQEREAEVEAIRSTPIESTAHDFLEAILGYETYVREGLAADFEEISRRLKNIAAHSELLALRGFPEAKDSALTGSRSEIIPRILAIRNGGGVGYELNSTMSVMNAIKQSRPENRKFHTIYLIAEAVYGQMAASEKPTWFQDWVSEIKRSIESGETMYVRPRRYDRLISLLFPQMRSGLEKSFGTEVFFAKSERVPVSRSQYPMHRIKNGSTLNSTNPSGRNGDLWLDGRELEQWKRTHPEAARAFFGLKAV